MAKSIHGTPVGEPEVAVHLGFADVHELRRWQTEIGRENSDLKNALKESRDEAERFRTAGMKCDAILKQCEIFLEGAGNDAIVAKLLKGISVVSGRGADFDHVLDDWLKPVEAKISADRFCNHIRKLSDFDKILELVAERFKYLLENKNYIEIDEIFLGVTVWKLNASVCREMLDLTSEEKDKFRNRERFASKVLDEFSLNCASSLSP